MKHGLPGLLLLASAGVATSSTAKNVTCLMQDGGPGHVRLDCGGQVFIPLHHSDKPEVFSQMWFVCVGCAAGCILCAALAAGLTLGLTSLEEFELQVLCNHLLEDVEPSATPRRRLAAQKKLEFDQNCAQRILPLISGTFFGTSSDDCAHKMDPSNQHYLLVTLLLLNATANEALPLFLNRLVPSWMACIISVTVVLGFGEIIPSAIFTGPRQLSLAAALSPIVGFAKRLFAPIVLPISLTLDKVLGHAHEPYSRAQIKALVRTLNSTDSSLEIDEANMLQGVLEMHHKKAQDVAHSFEDAKMLAHDRVLTEDCLKEIMDWGHSRLFVYRNDPGNPSRKDDIVGVVLVKKLIGITPAPPNSKHGPESKYRIGNLVHAVKRPVVLHPDDNLLSTLNKFQSGTCHLAILSDDPISCLEALRQQESIPDDARPAMFCSLEDVIEEMLKEEIYDEEDKELQRHNPFSDDNSPTKRSRNLMLNIKVGRKALPRLQRSFTTLEHSLRRPMSDCDLDSPSLHRPLLDVDNIEGGRAPTPSTHRRATVGDTRGSWKAFSER